MSPAPISGPGVWEISLETKDGHLGTVWAYGPTKAEATARARAQLVDVGVLPGPMHDAYKRLVAATKDGVKR